MVTDAATGSEKTEDVIVRLNDIAQIDGSRQERFIKAAARAKRETKATREQVRRLDRALAELEEATYGFFGIEYRKVGHA